MRAKKIYEAFKKGGDPLSSIGIGKKAKIDNWFKQYAPEVEYSIDNDFIISIYNEAYFHGRNITELPGDDFYINGNLDLEDNPISELPENLFIRGSLCINNTNISKLPDNLHIEGDLEIMNTNISHIDNINDNTYDRSTNIPGNLLIQDTLITELPDNLHVQDNLDIRNTNITELPDNLEVGDYLYLNKKIIDIPKTVKARRYIWP